MVKNVILAMLGSTVALNASAAGLDEKINEVVAPIVNPFVGMIFSTIPFPFSDVQVPWIVARRCCDVFHFLSRLH